MQRKEILSKVYERQHRQRRQEYSESASFAQLRASVIGTQKRKLKDRLARNTAMDPIEQRLGIYREELEPQFVDAGWRMAEAGIPMRQSGFNESAPEYQMLLLDGELNPLQKEHLQSIQVAVISDSADHFIHGLDESARQQKMTMLEFRPKRADIAEMRETWNSIADILIEVPETT